MQNKIEMDDRGIFEDTSNTIKKAIEEVHSKSTEKTKIAKTVFTIALNKII